MAQTKKEQRTVSNIRPAAYNPRTISEHQLNILERALYKFGDLSGFVENKRSGNLVGGHQRLKVIPKDCEVVVEKKYKTATRTGTVAEGYVIWEGERYNYRLVDWDGKTEKEANIAANKIGGEFDHAKLVEIMPDLDMDITGFTKDEMDKIFAEFYKEKKGKVHEDHVPEVDATPFVRRGEIWTCGDDHRVMCSDATNEKDLKKLIRKKQIGMVFTGLPYEADDFRLLKWLDLVRPYLEQGAFYICSRMHESLEEIFQWILVNTGREPRIIVWAKNDFRLGKEDYLSQHEFIFYSWFKKKHWGGTKIASDLWWFDKDIINKLGEEELRKLWIDTIDQTDLWEVAQDPSRDQKLPEQKPVALSKKAMRYSSKPGDTVIDFFGQAGSTLIGAYQMGRKGYILESNPYLAGMILVRFYTFTGIDPVRQDGVLLTEVMK